ncbi:MAG TPA: hypothetical protein VGE77_07070 [Nocardioides sp.]
MPPTSSRRTVLRAAAWSAPAIAVVAAAPAHAASGSGTIGMTALRADGLARIDATNDSARSIAVSLTLPR